MSGRYCVIIPAFEVAETIGALVQQVKEKGYPVIVVDDGSRDRTAAAAATAGAIVISHLKNRGKGNALQSGFSYALRSQFDGVITMDSDGQHDPEEIPHLIREGELQHAGLVLGDRMSNGASMPAKRRLANRLMSRLVSFAIRQQIADTQCGFRMIRRELLQDIPVRAKRFEAETELLCKAALRRWKIISVPVRSIYHNERSHIHPWRDGLRFVATLLRTLICR